MNENKDTPWLNYPEKLIQYASKFKDTKDDFERLVGYLLLDVGVESLLKAFVLADTSLKYPEREASAKGLIEKDKISESKISAVNFEKIKFHELLEKVRLIVKSKVTDDELKNAEHYHGIRNIIYHEGRKTFPSTQDFNDYLVLANSLLHKLFSTDKQVANHKSVIDNVEYAFLSLLQNSFSYLRHDIEIASVLVYPIYSTKSFQDSLIELGQEVDALRNIPYGSSIYEFAETEVIKKFNKLTDTKITDINFILEACFDVTYLQLAALLSIMHEDVFDELKKYVKYYDFSRKPVPDYNEITQEYMADVKSFQDWINTTREKINSWFEQNIVKNL